MESMPSISVKHDHIGCGPKVNVRRTCFDS